MTEKHALRRVFCLVLTAALICTAVYSEGFAEDMPYAYMPNVILSSDGSVFSVSVPTKLPFCSTGAGSARCADEISVTCISPGGVYLKSIFVTPPDDWHGASYDFASASDEEKHAFFCFQGLAIPGSGSADLSEYCHIEGRSACPVTYAVYSTDPSSDLYGILCADAVITVGWNITY